MSLADLPDIYYLDEPRVQQRMQIVNQGQIEKVVEKYSSTESSESRGGLSLYKFLEYKRSSSDETIEEFSRTVRSTPIGELVVLHGVIEEEEGPIHADELDNKARDSLTARSYITVDGVIERPPWTRLSELANRWGIDMQEELSGRSKESDERLAEELEEASLYYQVPMSGSCEGDFVFKLREENFQHIAREFPNDYQTYTLFSRVDHMYAQDEERHYIDFLNEELPRDRSDRTEQRIRKKKLDNLLDNLGKGDAYISYPDIVISPIAIYA